MNATKMIIIVCAVFMICWSIWTLTKDRNQYKRVSQGNLWKGTLGMVFTLLVCAMTYKFL